MIGHPLFAVIFIGDARMQLQPHRLFSRHAQDCFSNSTSMLLWVACAMAR